MRRVALLPRSNFMLTGEDLQRFGDRFQVPDKDELADGQLHPPPVGYATWDDWTSARWPTSLS